jgi:hypothetical protein
VIASAAAYCGFRSSTSTSASVASSAIANDSPAIPPPTIVTFMRQTCAALPSDHSGASLPYTPPLVGSGSEALSERKLVKQWQ